MMQRWMDMEIFLFLPLVLIIYGLIYTDETNNNGSTTTLSSRY
jgi:hypothetical protein